MGIPSLFLMIALAAAAYAAVQAARWLGAMVDEADVYKDDAASYAKLTQGTWQCMKDEGEN